MKYGYDGTIHKTGHVDVETDRNGKVVSVWFRCMALPFKQSRANPDRAASMKSMYENYDKVLQGVDIIGSEEQELRRADPGEEGSPTFVGPERFAEIEGLEEDPVISTSVKGEVWEYHFKCDGDSVQHEFSVLASRDVPVDDRAVCPAVGCFAGAKRTGQNPAEISKNPADLLEN